jgi:predicted nucleic acid-binding protein
MHVGGNSIAKSCISGAKAARPPDIISAIELHRLIRISFWDALIVHAARLAKVAVLYSEDLQPGAVLGGVRVVNPFAD